MENIKITNNTPYFCTNMAYNCNSKQYKRVYKYFLVLENKGYSFTRKKDLKAFLYKKIKDKTYKNKNQIDEQRVSCVVTNRKIINDTVHVHIYDLFNVTSFWDNYWYKNKSLKN